MLSVDTVRLWFEYDEEHGGVRKTQACPYAATLVLAGRGYPARSIKGKTYYEHQLVWMCCVGAIPAGRHLDHMNCDKQDNRIANLRLCTRAENQYNTTKRGHNTTGFKGVVFHKACPGHPYQAKIVVEGQVRSLGYYATPAEASQAYITAAKQIAGEFARKD